MGTVPIIQINNNLGIFNLCNLRIPLIQMFTGFINKQIKQALTSKVIAISTNFVGSASDKNFTGLYIKHFSSAPSGKLY